MREIKLRAWFKDELEMREVATNNVYKGNTSYMYLSPMPFSDYQLIELMQYTGLKDKNGKEIYEGDIIRIYNNDDDYWDDKVSFHLGAFFSGDEDLLANVYFRAEVIGNIYENPELLEDEKRI